MSVETRVNALASALGADIRLLLRRFTRHTFQAFPTYPETPKEYGTEGNENTVTFTRALAEFTRLNAVAGDTGLYLTPLGIRYVFLLGANDAVSIIEGLDVPEYDFDTGDAALNSSQIAKGFQWSELDTRTLERVYYKAPADGVRLPVFAPERAGAAAQLLFTKQNVAFTKDELADKEKTGQVLLSEPNSANIWIWNSSDLSSKVAIDPRMGWIVPPASDVTGASGAWEAKYEGNPIVEWWHDPIVDDVSGIDYAPAYNAAFAAGTGAVTSYHHAVHEVRSLIDIDNESEVLPKGIDSPTLTIKYYSPLGLFQYDRWFNGTLKVLRISPMAGAGHACNNQGQQVSPTVNIGLWLNTDNALASWMYGDGIPVIKTAIYGCINYRIGKVYGATTGNNPQAGSPLFDVVHPDVSFRDCNIDLGFVYGPSDNPIVKVHCNSDTGTLNTNNVWRIWTAETAFGGLYDIAGELNSVFYGQSYDLNDANDAGATLNADAIIFRLNTDNRKSESNKIFYNRRAGDIGAHVDINLVGATNTYVEAFGQNAGASKQIVDCASTSVTTRATENTDFLNKGIFVDLDIPSSVADTKAGAIALIASGVHTLASNDTGQQLYRLIDTEASASTDTLTRIIGGFPGQRILYRTVANARDVTVQHGSNLTCAGSSDKILSRINDNIEFICREADSWDQIGYSDNTT